MTVFQIIEAKPWHCGQIIRSVRKQHELVIADVGGNLHRELHDRFSASSFRRAWLIDGELAALGGVVATPIASTGYIWLALGELALRHRIATVREARRQLDEIMRVKREIATVILPEDTAALRLAIFLGFHVSHDGLGSPASTRVERLALRRFLEAADEIRIPLGRGRAIPVGYHVEVH